MLSAAAVFGVVAGALVDRWDRRKTMLWVDVGRAALAFLLVALSLSGQLPVLALAAVVLVMSLGSYIFFPFFPAQSALLPSVVPEDQLTAANSMNQSGLALAHMVGSSFGGIVLGLFGAVAL